MKTWAFKLCFRVAYNPILYRRISFQAQWKLIRGQKGHADRKWGNLP